MALNFGEPHENLCDGSKINRIKMFYNEYLLPSMTSCKHACK